MDQKCARERRCHFFLGGALIVALLFAALLDSRIRKSGKATVRDMACIKRLAMQARKADWMQNHQQMTSSAPPHWPCKALD